MRGGDRRDGSLAHKEDREQRDGSVSEQEEENEEVYMRGGDTAAMDHWHTWKMGEDSEMDLCQSKRRRMKKFLCAVVTAAMDHWHTWKMLKTA